MQTSRIASCALLVLVVAACSSQESLTDSNSGTGPGGTGGTPADNGIVVQDSNQNQTARNYSCGPIGYRAAGNVLVGLGVDVKIDPLLIPLPDPNMKDGNNNNNNNNDQTPPGDAQKAYTGAKSSFGVADYQNRNPEATQIGTAQLAKMGDLFIQAAPEILAKFNVSPRCGGVTLVDGNSHFTREALSCLGGEVVTAEQVTLAGQMMDRAVGQGMTQSGAQELVIAGFLSAQFTCR